ncbi:MAG: 1-acyl-sn-glycerol-3-phosphate acyltransferase [Deltaproteobacteria bacterium]|nr:1-acyl-sn-glycerol-3-phosphate acyltransferase [Deltaproteobacteria bacterium]
MNSFIFTSLMVAFISVTSVFMFIFALLIWFLTVLFDKKLKILHLYSSFWAAMYLWIWPGLKIKIEGRENIRKEATYMVISNHQSQIDILAYFAVFFHFKWVSKASVFNLPLIGWNMVLNRYIKLKRGDAESIKQMLIDSERAIDEGNSVFMFPEGTRSYDGIVKPFKHGAFTIAQKKQIPILPLAISGTIDMMPKNSIAYSGNHRIHIRVLDEIPYESFKDLSPEELAVMCREMISKKVILNN